MRRSESENNKFNNVGLILSAEGLKLDSEKVRAVKDMPSPKTKEDVCRFLN